MMSVCFMATHLLRTRLASSYPSLITYCYCSTDSRIARLAEPEVRHCPSASRGHFTGIMETARREKTRHMVRNSPNTDVLPPADGTLVVSMESRGMGNI